VYARCDATPSPAIDRVGEANGPELDVAEGHQSPALAGWPVERHP
jgi:hypothetical protein